MEDFKSQQLRKTLQRKATKTNHKIHKSNHYLLRQTASIAAILFGFSAPIQAGSLPHYQFVDLGTLGGHESVAKAINERRQITGWSTDSTEAKCLGTYGDQPCKRGFIWYQSNLSIIQPISERVDNLIPAAISEDGVVVGYQLDYVWENNQLYSHTLPIKWEQGQTQLLNLPEGTIGAASDINAFGDTVGWYQSEGQTQRIALWREGQLLEISPHKRLSRIGVAINASGWVAGWEYEPRSFLPNQAFLVQEVHISLSDSLNIWSESMAINNYGAIAGNYSINPHRPGRATIWYKTILGSYHREVIGKTNSSFLDINNLGYAVGYQIAHQTPDQLSSAILYQGGELYDLNRVLKLDVHLAQASSINNNGDIVGYYYSKEGHQRAFALLVE